MRAQLAFSALGIANSQPGTAMEAQVTDSGKERTAFPAGKARGKGVRTATRAVAIA